MLQPANSIPPLDTLMRRPIEEIYDFGQGSTQIRNFLAAREGVLLEAYRGAAPLDWAASGLETEETSPIDNLVRVISPLGTYLRPIERTDKYIPSGSTRSAKFQMIAHSLIEATYFSDQLTILDEVQIGGTVTSLAIQCARHAEEYGISLPIHVITGEDRKFAPQRMGRYKQMVAGSRAAIVVNPVATTLIATDRDSLLPEILYRGSAPEDNETEKLTNYRILPNPEAELLLRCIGTLARKPALARDKAYIHLTLSDVTRTASTEAVNEWVSALSDRFSRE